MSSLFGRFLRAPAIDLSVTQAEKGTGEKDTVQTAVEKTPVESTAPDNTKAADVEAVAAGPDPSDASDTDLPDDLRDIPVQVRTTVNFDDNPSEATITFRYFLIVFILIPPGAFISELSQFRTTQASYSVFFVQIISHYLGLFFARVLPAWRVRVPGTSWSFSTNPGPWGTKEHVLVTVTAAQGATSNLASTPIALSQLYYNSPINAAACIFFMWSCVFLGYSYAALARQFLVYDPLYTWPQALMQTSLFENLRSTAADSRTARKAKHVFFGVLIAATLWQFLPEYVFPFVSSLSFLCWVAPHNKIANFIGGGLGGMGFLNLSLDWANISNSSGAGNPMITPFWTSVVMYISFIFGAWVLLPAAKWGKLGAWNHALMSNAIFLRNGTKYPADRIITAGGHFNQTAYDGYGPAYMGLQMRWNNFFDYASFTSAFAWMFLFGWPHIKDAALKIRARLASGQRNAYFHYHDRLNATQRAYREVPLWWFGALFACSFVTIIVILAKGLFFIPIWTFIVGLLVGAACVVPMGWLYALSNFQVAIGSTNELVYGYMVGTSSNHRHPAGASTYGAVAGDAWYRAQYLLQDQKIGHYMHIPPRALFFSQIFAEIIGVPINYGVIQWVLRSKGDYLLGRREDPLHQWTGQALASSNTIAIQYVVIGSKRLFSEAIYAPLKYGYLFGAAAPLVIYAAYRLAPRALQARARFDLWNVTIFASTVATFYGNMTTGNTSRIIVAWVSMYWFYRKHFDVWKRYNYLVAAALDAAFNINMLLIFIIFNSGRAITMPNWWGNNPVSVERCFALGGD